MLDFAVGIVFIEDGVYIAAVIGVKKSEAVQAQEEAAFSRLYVYALALLVIGGAPTHLGNAALSACLDSRWIMRCCLLEHFVVSMSGMVFELLRDCFTHEDPASGSDLLFDLCIHIAQGRVFASPAYLLDALLLLALEKPSGGIRRIVVGEVDIQNALNTVSREALFHELRTATGSLDQLFPFVHSFYARRLPLYFSHCSREDEVSLLSSESSTCQEDPLGGALFALAHLCSLRTMASEHPLCLFPSLANDTHIVGPLETIVPAFHTLEGHLSAVGLIVQPTKCATWSPSGLSSSLSLPPGFSLPSAGLRVLGAPIGSDSF
ncbi:hypothetical protein R1flu_008825 [Riccia fluitans]|uniref:Uncharacterized protein n=1 Tax=Riccia fluitans TaxID=41844 RepID=A0ABD1Z161_9MARC